MTIEKARVVPEDKIAARFAAFERDVPLHDQLPITLNNGRSVPTVHITCDGCGGQISGDRVRGRVVRSLQHVVTIEANGLCEPCNRLTPIHCRFRASGDKTFIEWIGSDGLWHAREHRQPTLAEKINSQVRHLLSQ